MKLSPAPRIAHGRCAHPDETVARLEAGLGRICSYRYHQQMVSDTLYWGALEVDQLDFPPMGKGSSPVLCKASTLAEAAEWLALRRRRELTGYRQANQVDVPDALPIGELLSHIASATPELVQRILTTDAARHWVDGWSLLDDRARAVPLEYLHGISGTNGVAAGNCMEEAIVQGANEIFERRAAITVVKNRMIVPTIDPDTIENPVLRGQIDALRAQGIELTIKDLSFGGALPCVGVYFVRPGVSVELQSHHALKAAGSFDREAALMSCLTEYAQLAKLKLDQNAEPPDYERMACSNDTDNFLPLFWFGYVPFAEAEFLTEGEVIPFDPGTPYADCLQDIEQVVAICRRLDKDLVVVDLTDPDLGFPVVQVVIPGYSDILPFHPSSSRVLFEGWTRRLAMGYVEGASGPPRPVDAGELFPGW